MKVRNEKRDLIDTFTTCVFSKQAMIEYSPMKNLYHRIHDFMISCACAGSRSTPFFDTSGSVHMLRLKQHGLRSPALSFEHVTSIRRLRVSDCLVERIQRIQSQRAIGVISIQRVYAWGAAARAV